MNEKIKDLAISTGIYDCIIDPYDIVGDGNPNSSVFFDLERFAEQIILECANIALREDHDPYECILKHFGIATVDDLDDQLRNRSTYFGNDV